MATYNGQQHLRRQLESLAAQTYLPAELVITDDRSDDGTPSIVAEFATTSPFHVYFHPNENRLGYRRNFMRAASLCTSELIAFCDQDDRWYANKLESSVARFDEKEVLLAYHNADVVLSDDRKIGSLELFAARQSIVAPMSFHPMAHVLGFTMVFRSLLLRLSDLWPNSIDHLNPSEPMGHDQWFFSVTCAWKSWLYR